MKIRYKHKLEKWTIRIAVALVISYLVVGSVVVFANEKQHEKEKVTQLYKTFKHTHSAICKDGNIRRYERGPYGVTEKTSNEGIVFVSVVKRYSPQKIEEWFFIKEDDGYGNFGKLLEWEPEQFFIYQHTISKQFYKFAKGLDHGCSVSRVQQI